MGGDSGIGRASLLTPRVTIDKQIDDSATLDAVPKARWSTIHFVKNGDKVWMFNERGELVLGKLSPTGFEEISRAKIIEPTKPQLNRRGGVCWSHPAFANGSIFVRNDRVLKRISLKDESK